jgi:hypothetical protein
LIPLLHLPVVCMLSDHNSSYYTNVHTTAVRYL